MFVTSYLKGVQESVPGGAVALPRGPRPPILQTKHKHTLNCTKLANLVSLK